LKVKTPTERLPIGAREDGTSVDPRSSILDPRSSTQLRRRAVRGGVILLASRWLTQVLVWAVTLIVARLLRPYDYGLMTTGTIFVGLADLLAEAGVSRALIQKDEVGDEDLAEGFTLCLVFSLVLYGLLFAVAGPAAVFLDIPEFTPFLRVLALLVLLVPFRSIPLALLDRELRLGKQSAVHVASAVVQASLVLGLAAAGFGFWALAAGVLSARVLETVALSYYAGWRPRLRKPGARARGLLGFGVYLTLGTLLWFVYSNADFAVVGKLAGPVALGFYSLAFQLISLPVQKLTANVNQIAYPVFCRLQHDRARVRSWYLRLTVLLSFLGMPAMAGMALVAEDGFSVVLGEKWLRAVLPFQLLSIAGIALVIGSSLPPLFNALGRPDINFKYTAACALVFPVSFFVMGLFQGVIGICLVWLVFYPLMVGGLVFLNHRTTGFGLRDLLSVQAPVVGATLFMAGCVLAAQWLLADLDLISLRLGLTVAVGVAAYGGFTLAFARHTVLADLRAVWRELKG
jgi:O-antigen/teichoic acid export membrane protein